MKTKGFIKTIFLFIILVILLLICWFLYSNHKDEVKKAGDDVKNVVQEKKDDFINSAIEEGKNSLGKILKDMGEEMLKKEESLEKENLENLPEK